MSPDVNSVTKQLRDKTSSIGSSRKRAFGGTDSFDGGRGASAADAKRSPTTFPMIRSTRERLKDKVPPPAASEDRCGLLIEQQDGSKDPEKAFVSTLLRLRGTVFEPMSSMRRGML